MIFTKEQQEKAVNEYMLNNNMDKVDGFMDGMKAALELVDRILKADSFSCLDENIKGEKHKCTSHCGKCN